jgi:hypothetical protein
LEGAGILDTWQAVSCLKLAELIDSAKHGASGAAGNTKALREAISYAMSSTGADKEADIIFAIFSEP